MKFPELYMAVAHKTGTNMGCPGKWKHGPKPAYPLLFNFEPHPHLKLRGLSNPPIWRHTDVQFLSTMVPAAYAMIHASRTSFGGFNCVCVFVEGTLFGVVSNGSHKET